MTSSIGHAHLRTCGMKIQNAQIALKLDTDVAESLAASKVNGAVGQLGPWGRGANGAVGQMGPWGQALNF